MPIAPLTIRWIKLLNNPEEKLKGITDKIPLGQRMTTPKKLPVQLVFLLQNKI